MRECLIVVALLFAAGCAEEPVPEVREPANSEDAHYSEAALEAEEDVRKEVALVIVEEAVQAFRILSEDKRYPHSLLEIVNEGLLTSLPNLPAGSTFDYNASTGEVAIREYALPSTTAPETDDLPEAPEAGSDGETAAPVADE